MNLLEKYKTKHAKKNIPSIRSGDVIRVHERIKEGKKERIQVFEGIVISIHGGKILDATFCVRKISFGIGVEKIFPLHSPKIIKIETIKKIRSRKSKLYYLRNLTDKQIQKRSELKKYVVWEDTTAKKEEEELKKIKETEAKAKAETKHKEQEELDKKFTQAKGEVSQVNIESKETKTSEESKENKDKKDDQADKKSRK